MEKIMDVVSCVITPYLIYFGELGITPKVEEVQAEEILYMREIEGKRLGELSETLTDENTELYENIGKGFGIISHYGIQHGHPHSYNVVIDKENNPFIIDWGMAGRWLTTDFEQCYKINGQHIINDLPGRLKSGKLEEAFKSGFIKSWKRTDLLSDFEINERANKIMYGL